MLRAVRGVCGKEGGVQVRGALSGMCVEDEAMRSQGGGAVGRRGGVTASS